MAVGDIMPGTNYPDDSYLPPADGKYLIAPEISRILVSGDITCGNLEGCLLDEGKKSLNKNNDYFFRIPESLAGIFTDNGFDFLSIANNHAGDFDEAGRQNTQKILNSMGIAYAGQINCPTAIITRDNIRIGFIALSPNRGCISHWDMQEVLRLIKKLEAETDMIIASMHYGGEGEKFLHLSGEAEIYFDEDRGNPIKIAHQLVDAGVDLVYGHGPHLPRAMECYRGKLIAYSLGNFMTWKRFDLSGDHRPLAPILRVNYDHEGNFISGEIISCIQDNKNGVYIDQENRAYKLMRKLTLADFAEPGLRFDDDLPSTGFYPVMNSKKN